MSQKRIWWFLWAIKITLILASVIIVIGSILTSCNVIAGQEIEKCKIGWPIAIIIALLYSIIPFSVKSGMWTNFWIMLFACLGCYFTMAIILQTQSYKIAQFYFLLLPHLLIIIAVISWLVLTSVIIKTEQISKKNKKN